VAVSGPETVDIAADKVRTHRWLCDNDFPTMRLALAQEVLARPDTWDFPVIAKPRGGSAGMGVLRATSPAALALAVESRDDLVVQEIAAGQEYTINVYVNRAGRCLCAVPHLRLEVRSGEVSKAVTAKHEGLMRVARGISEALPEAYGTLNIQCFMDGDGIRIIEINPRFGGGYPVAHAAGVDFPRWLLLEAAGQAVEAACDDWRDNLAMLRYDEAVFVSGDLLREPPATTRRQKAGDAHA
jgi:carbamoyl-phosphate synthase large subunit